METVLVQINNNKAYKLLENLEELHVLKVLKKARNKLYLFLINMPVN